MYANPQLYNRANFLQMRDGIKVIQRIKSELAGQPIGTILDIGCGTGNLTELVFHELKPKRIVAFDKEAKMVAFASENTKANGAIVYCQADACDPFEVISEKLKLQPESVDLVVSFYVMHWVPNKGQACKTMHKLLKKNGKFYIILSVWNDLFPVQREIIRHPFWRKYLLEKLCEIKGLDAGDKLNESALVMFDVEKKPNPDTMHQIWQSMCLQAALVMEEMCFTYADYAFKSKKDFQDQVESVCYWLNFVDAQLHGRFLADYFQIIDAKYLESRIAIQEERRRSLNIDEKLQMLDINSGPNLVAPTMITEEEAVTMFRFEYIYSLIVGRKPFTGL